MPHNIAYTVPTTFGLWKQYHTAINVTLQYMKRYRTKDINTVCTGSTAITNFEYMD